MSSVYTKTPHQKIDNKGISSQWEGNHIRFPFASIGEKNKIKSNAPPGSKTQFDILINNVKTKGKSGWHVWYEYGNWYHLGGSKRKKPTIYQLNKNNKWTTKGIDQSKASDYYKQYGKII